MAAEWFETLFVKGWTPGATGVWFGVGMLLLGWWKGLPAVLERWDNRQSRLEERMSKLLDEQAERFKIENDNAQRRHDECEERVAVLRAEVDEVRLMLTKALNEMASAKAANAQLQLSMAEQMMRSEVPTTARAIEDMVAKLGDVPGIERKMP